MPPPGVGVRSQIWNLRIIIRAWISPSTNKIPLMVILILLSFWYHMKSWKFWRDFVFYLLRVIYTDWRKNVNIFCWKNRFLTCRKRRNFIIIYIANFRFSAICYKLVIISAIIFLQFWCKWSLKTFLFTSFFSPTWSGEIFVWIFLSCLGREKKFVGTIKRS